MLYFINWKINPPQKKQQQQQQLRSKILFLKESYRAYSVTVHLLSSTSRSLCFHSLLG